MDEISAASQFANRDLEFMSHHLRRSADGLPCPRLMYSACEIWARHRPAAKKLRLADARMHVEHVHTRALGGDGRKGEALRTGGKCETDQHRLGVV